MKIQAEKYMRGRTEETFEWGRVPRNASPVQLRVPGAYAVVKCVGESFYRGLLTEPVPIGTASGHAGLASCQPVEFAGEILLDWQMRAA
eukprot:5748266-Pyramimonas_sp.AAC.1